VAANMGVIPPQPGFLKKLRELTKASGTLLIFDEVITGFRVAYGGAQELYGVMPDLTCLGKIIGGGLPVGAYGGSEEIMRLVAPLGPVYQAGTLSGNPLAMTAGIETLTILRQGDIYTELDRKSSQLEMGVLSATAESGISLQISRIGSLLTAFFTSKLPHDYESAMLADTLRFGEFFRHILDEGIYWPPSQFVAAFISLAHTNEDIEATVAAFKRTLSRIKATAGKN
jgi:glutamate-1-semialdehyde 2,1-aminomutase